MTTSTERNSSIAKRWFRDLWTEGRLEVADEIVDPGYAPDWIQIDAKGPEQVKHEVRYFRSVFPDLEYELIDFALGKGRVWVRYKGTGTQMGNAWGFEPSGRPVEFEGVTIFYISQEGKIIDRWGAFCFYDILTDLGLVPPFWELSEILNGSTKD
jgi:hypothetical protein